MEYILLYGFIPFYSIKTLIKNTSGGTERFLFPPYELILKTIKRNIFDLFQKESELPF